MAKLFDFSESLDFNDIDLTAPNLVAEEIANQIAASTSNIICGKVSAYGGHIMSYTQPGLAGLAAVLGTADKKVDIQKDLGRQGEETHKYEFYIVTPVYEQYKYRICFFQFGIGNYPVRVVLEQGIANSILPSESTGYIINCNSREDFENLLVKIIYSKPVIAVMQELIRIHQIKRDTNTATLEDHPEEN